MAPRARETYEATGAEREEHIRFLRTMAERAASRPGAARFAIPMAIRLETGAKKSVALRGFDGDYALVSNVVAIADDGPCLSKARQVPVSSLVVTLVAS